MVVFLVARLVLGSRGRGSQWLKCFAQSGIRIVLSLVPCVCVGAEVTDPAVMLERMRDNFVLEPGTSIGNRIEAEVTWRMKEEGPALRSGIVKDQVHVLSEGDRFGIEHHRQSPDGERKTRTVYQGDERREFEFDLNARGEGAVVGKLSIRHQFGRGPAVRLPLLDYLDRLLGPPNRLGYAYDALELATETVPVDGHPCHEVRGRWNGRDFTFWLDPEFGYLPRQYTIQVEYSAEFSGRRRGWRNPSDLRLLDPPPELKQNAIPTRLEERLSAVELTQREGRFYLSSAIRERSQYMDGGGVYSERTLLQTGDYVHEGRRNVNAFLEFEGLIRNGTPVEEFQPGDRDNPETVERYVLSDGRKLPHYGGLKEYISDLGNDLARLSRDFSLQNLQRIDSKFLVAVCAVAALLINGGIAYSSYRKKRPKPS